MRFLLFVLPFITVFTFAQNVQELNFIFINQNTQHVGKNEKLELGLSLPDSILRQITQYLRSRPHQRTGLNPFVEWDVNIKANFTHINSGEKYTAYGFWYTEMERDMNLNRWKDLDTDLPFRVRFAPTETGKWNVELEVFIKQELFYSTPSKEFEVVNSDAKGYVTLNKETQYLERDGKTIIPTGVNIPMPSNKNNLDYSLTPEETLDVAAWEEYRNMITKYIDQGGEYFRFFLHPSSTDIEFEEVGNYQNRQNHAWELDQLLALCEKNNTLIHFNLMYHTFFMKLGDYHQFRYDFTNNWPDENLWPYKDPNKISGYAKILNSDTPSDMFLTKTGMRYLKQRVRYILSRWGYSTSLLNIELLCEPWHVNENPHENDRPYDDLTPAGDTARKAIYEYHKQMSSYILDSLEHRQHLLSAVGRFPVGKTHIYSHLTEKDPNVIDSTWYLDNIDLIIISYYSDSPEKLIFSKPNKNNECDPDENSMACTVKRLKDTYGKPVLMGESDHGDGTHMCSDYQGHYIDIMRYPYTGVIGHLIWAAFIVNEEKNRNEMESWPRIIAAKDYYNSKFFINLINKKTELGREKSKFKGSKKDIVETQYIIGQQKEIAAGYVYNRTFNVNTANREEIKNIDSTRCAMYDETYTQPIDVTWKPQRLHVEGLKAFSKYRIIFYDFVNQSFIFQAELRTTLFGKLKIVHPKLVPAKSENPLLWYRIEKIN
ncbi:hypothetical protein CW751_05310 [Brumimicrobium salinarum]|uniref:DUF5060 domain-containing protein n=1 Tax=Brumimicrobium salinarum TaxID=2058658 RepID=A0A2I0R4F5_9FLAO|nr:DUF5060 domain-containing protein [Brumimicrobium salinarum]PKR81472.1 hypothetical protein CW751_05310 [Brumimicrobium salinarum]